MFNRLAFVAAAGSLARCGVAVLMLLLGTGAHADDAQVLTITRALAAHAGADPSAFTQTALPVELPDDWSATRPRFEGSVWYRTGFDRPAGAGANELTALSIERACSTLEVWLNHLITNGIITYDDAVARSVYPKELNPAPNAAAGRAG